MPRCVYQLACLHFGAEPVKKNVLFAQWCKNGSYSYTVEKNPQSQSKGHEAERNLDR